MSPSAIEQARSLQEFLGDRVSASGVTVRSGADQQLVLPPELATLVLELVDLIGRGCTVTVGSIPNEVTTTVAARMLNMSRPSLMKLVREGRIPAHKVASHTRLYSKDVLAFRRSQLEHQSKAFDELRASKRNGTSSTEKWAALRFVARPARCHGRVICPVAR